MTHPTRCVMGVTLFHGRYGYPVLSNGVGIPFLIKEGVGGTSVSLNRGEPLFHPRVGGILHCSLQQLAIQRSLKVNDTDPSEERQDQLRLGISGTFGFVITFAGSPGKCVVGVILLSGTAARNTPVQKQHCIPNVVVYGSGFSVKFTFDIFKIVPKLPFFFHLKG